MNKPIEVGCWAVIYKPTPCCGWYGKYFGIPFIVHSIGKRPRPHVCGRCKISIGAPVQAFEMQSSGNLMGAILAHCKRIDPPSETESTEEERVMSDE